MVSLYPICSLLMEFAYLSGATRSMPIGVRVVVARVGIAVVVVDVRRGQWVVVLYQVWRLK